MFRASSAHLQEDTVVYMQHIVLSLSMTVPGGLPVYSLRTDCRGKVVGGVLLKLVSHSSCVPAGHQELS